MNNFCRINDKPLNFVSVMNQRSRSRLIHERKFHIPEIYNSLLLVSFNNPLQVCYFVPDVSTISRNEY